MVDSHPPTDRPTGGPVARGAVPAPQWSVVLPVKGGRRAKTRLGAGPALALGIARDTVAAVLGCDLVASTVVVTADDAAHAPFTVPGAAVRTVTQPADGPGLLGAIRTGLALVPHGPVAVLLADLPALRPTDLAAALTAARSALADGAPMAAVPDADGGGTVLLAATGAQRMTPAFGPGSLARHRALGARVLDLDLPRLRRDVDTAEDLRTAVALGVGRHTLAALDDAAPTLGPCRPPCTASTP